MLYNMSQFNLHIRENQDVVNKKRKKHISIFFQCWEYSARSQLILGSIFKNPSKLQSCVKMTRQ